SVKPEGAANRAETGVLILGALAAIALLAFSIRRFGAAVAPGALLWYLAFGTAAVVLTWCAVRLNPAARLNLALACVAVTVTLYGTEVAIGLTARAKQFRVQDQ